jgi:TRAP-type C4-dicarboxylate transport system substrate-binding protein
MQIVKDLGAAPTPIPFTELYSALQLKVVDGQENPVSVFRHPKLEEVQKYMILDGHVFSMTTYLINERWFQSLPDDLRTAIDQSVQISRDMHNAISYLLEKKDIGELREMGVDVYDPPVEVKMEFRGLTQKSALEWLRRQDNVDQKWIDQLLAETKQVETELGYSSK